MRQEHNDKYELCKDHIHAYVLAEMHDGSKVDGIITGVDAENVYLAVPIGAEEMGQQARQFGYHQPGYGHGGFGYPRPRFNRMILPLTFLATLSLLPWY